MKPNFILSAVCSLIALSVMASAQNLSELVAQLNSDQMNQRTEARSGIQQLLTDSTAPTADANARSALEEEALQILQSDPSHPAQVWLLRMLELTGSEVSVPVIASYLNSTDGQLRDCARRALVANPASEATAVLYQAMLRSSDAEKRAYIDGFAFRGDGRAAKAIVPLLKSDDADTVVQAANALIVLGEDTVYSEVKAAHASAPEGSRAAIELAMLATGADASTCKALISSSANVGVAEAAFVALLKKDTAEAVAVLRAAVDEAPSPLRTSMLGSAMTEPALQAILLDSLDLRTPEDQLIILSGIAEQEITSAEASVIALLSSADQAVRKQAIFTLGVIGGSASFSSLYALFLNESDEDASKALAKLDLATINKELFETVEESNDLKQRSAAMQLLALRNAEGAADLFNRTIAPGNPDDLRVECMKALEVLGTVESCQAMAQFIVSGDSVKRSAQKSLKRLCLNYGDPDLLWDSVFVPALKTAANDAVRGDLLVIADAVAGDKLLTYIQQQIADTESSLRPAVLKTLQRWPHMEASKVWLELISTPNVSASDIKAAQSGLGRMVKSKEVGGWEKLKLNQIVVAVEKAPTAKFKQAMVNLYLKPNDYIQHYLHDAFEQFANDPDISVEVAKVLATVSESKVRRKR
ncbi:MAG: hypothetical protein ACJ0BK_05465 [Coraliomargaritaceae bacterium]